LRACAKIAETAMLTMALVAAAAAPIADPIAVYFAATAPSRLPHGELGLAALRDVPLGTREGGAYQAAMHRAIVLARVVRLRDVLFRG